MFLSKFLREQEAAVLPVAALSIVALLGFGTLAVDIPRGYLHKGRLQAATDAAALAGASESDKALAVARATEYLQKNLPGWTPDVGGDTRIEFGDWHRNLGFRSTVSDHYDAVRVAVRHTGENAVKASLAGILGFHDFNAGSESIALRQGPGEPWDVVVAQDVSGSFEDSLSHALAANRFLMHCVAANARRSHFGAVYFARDAAGLGLARMDNPTPGVDGDPDEIHIGENEREARKLYADIGNIKVGHNGIDSGRTNISAAIDVSTAMLESVPGANRSARRAIVLVSDGLPNVMRDGQQDAAATQEVHLYLDKAAQKGISVFTLYLDEGWGSFLGIDTNSIMSGYTRLDGTMHTTSSPEDLPAFTQQICNENFAAKKMRLVAR